MNVNVEVPTDNIISQISSVFLTTLIDYNLIPIIISAFIMAWMTHGVVMFFGRMTEIITYWKYKSYLALITTIIWCLYYFGVNKKMSIVQILQYTTETLFISLSIYSLLFMRLYDRVDGILDKYVGEDKEDFKEDKKKPLSNKIQKIIKSIIKYVFLILFIITTIILIGLYL